MSPAASAAASDPSAASRGRRLEFDPEEALAAALLVFWERGYDGASLTALTEAMGINKPSLYARFGNKEALFLKALDLYEREWLGYTRIALQAETAKGVAEALLFGALKSQADHRWPAGCLSLHSTMPSGGQISSVRSAAMERRIASETALVERFKAAKAAGDLPDPIDPVALARLLWTIAQGLCLQAANGAKAADLRRMAETALAIWPGR
ncbi:TetR/AcrR family transcriptional regulator [Sphingopyxis sp.]|uniref:TetR/AcrR family transcriptional regulator n=1 Tax=Sphingopyxis sp. TaxID=1908224 RepID=UPI002FCB297F